MGHRRIGSVVALLVAVLDSRAGAQMLTSEQAAHSAIILTPIGALPEIMRVRYGADTSSRGEIAARYGRYKFRSELSPMFHNVGVSGSIALTKRLRVGATAGYRTAEFVDDVTMASLDLSSAIWRKVSTVEQGGETDFGLKFSAGMGKADTDTTKLTARSLYLGAPITFILPQGEAGLLTLLFSPGAAYGYLEDKTGRVLGYVGGDGTVRGIFGAGLGYIFPFRLGVHATVHRVIADDAPTQLGFAVSWRL